MEEQRGCSLTRLEKKVFLQVLANGTLKNLFLHSISFPFFFFVNYYNIN